MSAPHLIITATERLARDLRLAANQQAHLAQKTAWEAPLITSLPQFALSLWQQVWDTERFIDPTTEGAIYRKIVTRSHEGRLLLNPVPTARQAQNAMALVYHYGVDIHAPMMTEQAEFHALQKWTRTVRTHQKERAWVGAAELLRRLVQRLPKWVPEGEVILPGSILLRGFLMHTPLESRFLDTLAGLGVDIEQSVPDSNTPRYQLVRDLTEKEELQRVAETIREVLEHCEDKVKVPRIAVVVPDVNKYRASVDQAFTPILAPHINWPEYASVPPPWRWMKGTPLCDHPIADAAIQILAIQGSRMGLDEATALLLNRHLGGAQSERTGRARIDYTLRLWGSRNVQLKAMLLLAEPDQGKGYAPDFAARLQALREHLRGHNTPALPSQWSTRFTERLSMMGWPGEQSLSSEAYQASEQVKVQLRHLATLDGVLGEMKAHEALEQIGEMLAAHPFLPRSDYMIPVEVMDMWDTPGHHYDLAFVVGMTAGALPERASPNPFLPYQLQKEAGVPSCCAETQYLRATLLKHTLSGLADEVIISCPMQTADGYHLTPSLLLGAWPTMDADAAEMAGEKGRAAPRVELEIHESVFPPVSDIELPLVRGGVSIMASYARAPIFATLEARLHLNEFPRPSEGISAATQGDILHAAMDLLWAELGNADGLKAREAELETLVAEAVEAAFADPRVVPPYSIGPRLGAIEKARAGRVMLRWLRGVELERPDPFEVIAREVAVPGEVNGLPIKLRIDRIDRVHTAHGEKILILDYKTGASVNVTGWQPESLTEPQLPIYATCVDLSSLGIATPDGIGFAHLSDIECKAHVRTNWTGSLTGRGSAQPVENWGQQLAEWRMQLETNAAGFLAGKSEVDYRTLSRNEVFHGYLYGMLRKDEQPA